MSNEGEDLRIFHGPINIGGTGGVLSEFERTLGVKSDFVTHYDLTLMQNHHFNLQIDNYNVIARNLMKIFFFLTALLKFNTFHFYFGKTLLPFNADLPILRMFGKKVLMTYCGSDIRLVSQIERKRNPNFKHLNFGKNQAKLDARKKVMMHWQNLWIKKFVAVRNLYEYANTVIPEKKIVSDLWINNLVVPGSNPPNPGVTKGPLIVLHAPTNEQAKGSAFICRVVEELKARRRNDFEFVKASGISHSVMLEKIARADIVIDQILLGGFGTLAVEAMNFGKPVMAFLIDEVKQKHFPDCPIVNVNVETLGHKLSELLDDPGLRRDIGLKGQEFVRAHCDINKVVPRLLDLYRTL